MPAPGPAGPPATGTPPADRPPVSPVPVVRRWVCCHCGGTGLTSDGDTCPHCHGHGHD